jgi:hypothetical protein
VICMGTLYTNCTYNFKRCPEVGCASEFREGDNSADIIAV